MGKNVPLPLIAVIFILFELLQQYQENRCFEQWDAAAIPQLAANPDCVCNRFYVYGVIARLSLLAAALELEI